ncbi:MAG TPA: ribbon-helix-helix protein, CopG family [Gammaproteobacteria bacterium]|nr:ribbon-helix-helix protein, CopG family [Gammaproteobacteria bacterium]
MDRMQVNVRLDAELAARIDEKRTELQKQVGRIPTRSEVVRIALDKYLGKVPRKPKG